MNSSQFMDKQILGLSGSGGGGGEFFDLMDPQEDRSQADKEEILPSYDFHPIRTVAGLDGPKPSWGSADSKIGGSALKYAGISEPRELAKVSHEKEKGACDVVTVAEIDHTMKKHADNLLHALEGVSSRLSQLESRTRHLETSVDELKVSVGNNNGSIDGKLRQLENILREVQTSVQVLCDKQEIAETQLELSKLQTSKAEDQPSPMTNTGQLDTKQQTLPPLTQPIQPSLQQPVIPPPPPSLPVQPAPNAPPPPPPQQNPLPGQFPPQVMQFQIPSLASLPRESYFSPPSQPTEATHQQYQIPLSQQPQQLQQPQHYQSPPQYSQPPPHPPQPVNPPPQHQPPLPHHSEESSPYMPAPVTYPPGIRQPSPLNQPSTGPPPHQFYGPNPSMYEPPSSRPSSGQHSFSSGYGPPVRPNFSDSYPNSGSPSHYSSSMKTSPFAASGASFGGSSSYPHPPTAQILPQAQPTGSGSGGPAGNRVPIDDVVDKVSTMGFSRDQVRATVRKLTENGQTVDLNVVLDKLMNDGQIQPQKGWFGQ